MNDIIHQQKAPTDEKRGNGIQLEAPVIFLRDQRQHIHDGRTKKGNLHNNGNKITDIFKEKIERPEEKTQAVDGGQCYQHHHGNAPQPDPAGIEPLPQHEEHINGQRKAEMYHILKVHDQRNGLSGESYFFDQGRIGKKGKRAFPDAVAEPLPGEHGSQKATI